MILSEHNEIQFKNSFPESSKKKLITDVLEYVDKTPQISIYGCLNQCHSAESGFTLPLTSDIKNAVLEEVNSDLLKYHNCRSFRFIERDNKIIGLRCKDALRYWTEGERILLKQIIEMFIIKL